MSPPQPGASRLAARLTLVVGAQTLLDHTLREGHVLVGRDPACALRVPEELTQLRRQHLQLWIAPDRLWVRALGPCTRSGTPLGSDVALRDGDVLELGQSVRLHVALQHLDARESHGTHPSPQRHTRILLALALCALGVTSWGAWRWWVELKARAARREHAQLELWQRLEAGEHIGALDALIQAALTPPVRIPGRGEGADLLSAHLQRVLADLMGRPPERPVDTFLRDAVLSKLPDLTDTTRSRCRCRFAEYRPELTRIFTEELERIGVPAERATWLVYIPWIESCYKPTACSKAGAVGMWQFMPRTAAKHGLTVSADHDERCDWRRSTRAAAQYFTRTFAECGAEYPLLAIAAYNTGEARACAIAKNSALPEEQRDVLPFYTHGYLLPETVDYVPRFLAATFLDQHPEEAYRLVSERLGRPRTPPTCATGSGLAVAAACVAPPAECAAAGPSAALSENSASPP